MRKLYKTKKIYQENNLPYILDAIVLEKISSIYRALKFFLQEKDMTNMKEIYTFRKRN